MVDLRACEKVRAYLENEFYPGEKPLQELASDATSCKHLLKRLRAYRRRVLRRVKKRLETTSPPTYD